MGKTILVLKIKSIISGDKREAKVHPGSADVSPGRLE